MPLRDFNALHEDVLGTHAELLWHVHKLHSFFRATGLRFSAPKTSYDPIILHWVQSAKSQTSSSMSSVVSDRSGPNYSQRGEEAELRYLGQPFINLEEVLHYSFLGLSSIWLLGEKFKKDYAQKVLDIDTLRRAQICQFLSVLLPPFICLDSLKGPVAASHIGLFSHDLCSSVLLLMIAFLFRLPKSYLSFSGFLCQFQKNVKKTSNGVGISM